MQRTKWSTVLQIASDGAQNNRHAGILSRAQNAVQVLFKVVIDPEPVWIVVSKLMLFKHVQATPCRWGGGMTPSLHQAIHPLAGFCRFQRDGGANQRYSRHARTEYSAPAKRADDFVVAHVNDPQIALMPGAFTCNGRNHVRIDGGHRHTDH